jgi:hypothetical protein
MAVQRKCIQTVPEAVLNSVEVVRYRPGEAIRWLQTGAENIRRGARAKGKSVVEGDTRTFGESLKTAAGAAIDFTKGAYADLKHRQAEASEYVMLDGHFDVVNGTSIKAINYDRVEKITLNGDRATLFLDKGTLTIKPFAYIVAGRAKVPVGWTRNGIEVPYELLLEELAAHCNLDIIEE